MARHHVRTQSLQATCSHLTKVAMQNADIEECRHVNKFEELDVVAAVKCRVDTNCKFYLVRLTDISTQLLHLPAVQSIAQYNVHH